MAEDQQTPEQLLQEQQDKQEQALVDDACRAYGINKKYILASRFDRATNTITLVTAGGSKISFAKGAKVEKLTSEAVTGISKKPKKVLVGLKKAEKKEA